MSDAKKTLMQISTCKSGETEGRPILTVELDGSLTYREPMTQAELKAMLEDMLASGAFASPLASQVVMATLFGSELARLNRENVELKRRLSGAPQWCPGCGKIIGTHKNDLHVCGGRGGGS